MQRMRFDEVMDHVTQVQGTVAPGRLTLFAILRDEMDFLPAFLGHYRALGFNQFLIFDDQSTDGTGQYLEAQRDVVLYRADRTFGAPVQIEAPDGTLKEDRFGTYLKAAIPHVACPGDYVAYFDADEFLILPPGVSDAADIVARLRAQKAACVTASVVEFFPETIADFALPMPDTAAGLFSAYPYFEPDPLVQLNPGADPSLIGVAKTQALFDAYGIRPRVEGGLLKRLMTPKRDRKAQRFMRSPRHKTPFVLRDAQTWQVGSHYCNRPPSDDTLLTIAHFVFTSRFADKIARARSWGAHTSGAAKYRYYAELLDRMRAGQGRFTGPDSVRYAQPQQMVDAGLMRW
ncbi:glycosyltransferase family 2 protein [Roseivivax sp. CAU 1753]